MRRRALLSPALVLSLALLAGGIVGGLQTGSQVRAAFVPHSDGAPANTMWVYQYLDVPGMFVADIHCHGIVRLVVQLGETGQGPLCGSPQGLPPGVAAAHSWSVDPMVYLPGCKVVVRRKEDDGPWRYGIEGQPGRCIS